MSNDLREAIEKWDWEGCSEALQKKLIETDQVKAARLCLEYFIMYLPQFTARNGDGRLLAIRMRTIEESGLFSAEGFELPPFPDMKISDADSKVRTVRWALFYFWAASRWRANDRVRAEYLAHAFARMIVIIYYEYPKWIPAPYDTADIRALGSKEYWQFLWTTLADNLE